MKLSKDIHLCSIPSLYMHTLLARRDVEGLPAPRLAWGWLHTHTLCLHAGMLRVFQHPGSRGDGRIHTHPACTQGCGGSSSTQARVGMAAQWPAGTCVAVVQPDPLPVVLAAAPHHVV